MSAPRSDGGARHSRAELSDLTRLLLFVRPYWPVLLLALAFSLLYSGSLVGRAALLQPLMDQVVLPATAGGSFGALREWGSDAAPEAELDASRARLAANVRANLWNVIAAAAALLLLMPIARLVRDLATDWLVTRLHVDLQRRVGDKLLRLPLQMHQRRGSGDVLTRFGHDTRLATRAQVVVFSDALQHGATVLAAAGLALYTCWQLALLALLGGPPILLVLRAFGQRIRRASRARQAQISEVTQRVLQILSGIKIIHVFGAEERERRQFEHQVERYFAKAMRVVRNRVYSRTLVEVASQGSFLALLGAGVYATLAELWGLTPGRLMAFVTIAATLYRPAKSGATIYNALQDALPGARRLFQILDAPERRSDPPGAVALPRLERGVVFRGVDFSYGREPVLEALDLEIRRGEVVALVGRTGAGKTTAIDLLMGIAEPTRGVIEIDGVDLRQLQRESLHRLIAVVTQEPFLFHTTIAENIRYGDPEASDAEVERAARAAYAHEFIDQLPFGYDTPVGQGGSQLSGGQRQRITIARAILRDPQLLIFDEATSSLDAKAETSVQRAIASLMHGRTVLLVAHRLATVRGADRIYVLESGRITASGTHRELRARPGLYRDLVALQLAPEMAEIELG